MTTLFAFLFVLGVLIFVHELGHFVMARRVGVRVLKFSLGFGPRLVGFTRGDTEYVISAIPLLILFVYATKPFMTGVTSGAFKA